MSGHKRALVRLSRQDLTRLESLTDRLRQVEQNYQDIRQTIQQDRQHHLESFNRALESRQDVFHSVIADFGRAVNNLELQTDRALLDQEFGFTARITDLEQVVNHNSDHLLQQHFNSVNSVLQDQQQLFYEQFEILREELGQVYTQKENQRYLAQQSIQLTQRLLQSTCAAYDLEKFEPGVIDRISQELESACLNLDYGMFEAALVISQQSVQELTQIRLTIEESLQQTALAQSQILEKTTALCILLQKNAFVNAIDLDGNALNYTIDVDFWTSGALTRLSNRCEGLQNQLKRNPQDMGIDEYQRIEAFILPQLEQSLGDLIAEARIKVILSQIRYNIAETVVENLTEQGFVIQEAVYNEMDERKPYTLTAQNLEGCQVKVFIGSGKDPGSYNLEIDSFEPGLYSDQELRNRANTLLRSLRSAGLRIGSLNEVQSEGPYLPPIRYSTLNHHQSRRNMSSYGN